MLREITTHKVNGLNEALQVHALDEPGAGGACHEYEIRWAHGPASVKVEIYMPFQKGPTKGSGASINGVSHEALLAIVRDRLEHFQAGPYACQENADALECVVMAMDWLRQRTQDRVQRGVEGTSTL